MKVQSRAQIRKGLQKMFDQGEESFLRNSEDFDGHKGGIWTGGEGDPTIDGVGAFDYWSGGEGYVFGVHPKVHKWLEERGWFGEWYDGGTMFLWKI
jgi:hypothetical protein